jgi:hypothetical protein
MATRIKARADDLHERDLYAWSRMQADLLRAGRFADIDLERVTEEIEDVGGALKRSARHRMRTIVEHLLRLEHAPATESRAGWRATVRPQRLKLRDALTPTVRREIGGELPGFFADARALADGALRDHGEHAAADALPAICLYGLDQITSDWPP